MKRIFTFILCLMMIICCVACKKDETIDKSSNENSNESVEKDSTDITPAVNDEETPWGVTENTVVDNNNKLLRVFVNFSDFTGPTRGSGKLATQSDGSIMLFDGQSPEITLPSEKIEDVFPAYFERAVFMLESEYVAKRKNFDFTIEQEENVTINGYEMCKISGKHSYTVVDENYKEKDYSCNYVAYATRTKGNDAIVYWMVIDGTKDNSLVNKIDELGQKMANSFCEQQ